MRIVLKPLGIVLVTASLVVLGVTSYLGLRTPQNITASPAVPSYSYSFGNAAPAPDPNGRVSWNVNPADKSVDANGLGSDGTEFEVPAMVVNAPAGQGSGAFSARVRAITIGKTSRFPKYAIKVRGDGADHWLEAWIDPVGHVLATTGQVGPTHQEWRNTPLPADFDPTKDHEIRIEWLNNGSQWHFQVDGNPSVLQQNTFPQGFMPNAVLLRCEDTHAIYHDITVH